MNNTISIVILAAGILLVVFGVRAADSVSSAFSRVFTGAPTEKSIWLLISGLVLSAVGLVGLARGTRS